jgi:hypothetical protein
MSEPRAQRTLVKSPPELWAEISDAGTLARRLGEFGDIRITRLEAETTVVWEGDRARGTVELEASGWGTKVTITASAIAEEAPTTAPSRAVEDEAPAPEAVAATTADEPAPEAAAEPDVVAEPEEPEADEAVERTESVAPPGFGEEPVAVAPPKRRGFLARLFGRRERVELEPIVIEKPMAKAALLAEPASLVAIAVPAEPKPEPEPVAAVTPPEPDEEIVVTALAMEDDEVEAVLVSVLDDLGSAHHRPFSRG